MPLALPAVYAITSRSEPGPGHAEIVRRLVSVGVRCVQVREKTLPDRDLLPDADACAAIGRRDGALVFVNDRADVARIAGTGVHLGTEDLPAEDARRILGPDAAIGVSTHSVAEAEAAFSAPEPDYVAFGPVFPSVTKSTREARGLETLSRVARSKTRPLVAIGGIGPETLLQVLEAGADSAAMVAAFSDGGRYEENARRLLDLARRRVPPGRIYLVGFMGSGKTSVGRRVAERLRVPFVDLDDEIERTSGRTVRALFEDTGEAAFRQRESIFLEATGSLPDAVIATGGGCFVQEGNRRAIASLGRAVFLDVPLPVLLSRLAGKTDRPLFAGPEQAALLAAAREPFYRMGTVPVSLREGSIEEAADSVLLALDARLSPLL
ncbi:MAG: thiamine phosphate synthase [Acidobacteria bacterium]|nr:thiamine phosphate synthase [Acidobacteriota bacterium]MCA1611110.1 thiamine phosphate synthase [Acidobacteriota bacterium]